MKPDNKPKRRKLLHSYESLEMQRNKNKEKMQETLNHVGYRKPEEYRDYVSHLAW